MLQHVQLTFEKHLHCRKEEKIVVPCAFCIEPSDLGETGYIQPTQACQFDYTEEQLVEFTDQSWCPLHLPLQGPSRRQSPKAAWEPGQIQAFNQAIFTIIDNAKKNQQFADLSGVVFPGQISFEQYTHDNGLPDVLFVKAIFNSDAKFEKTTFRGNTRFNEAIFAGEGLFRGATFDSDADFSKTLFRTNASFVGATFNGKAQFQQATFADNASFLIATFNQQAAFDQTDFRGDAGFRETTFTSAARFRKTTFGAAGKFIGASFHADALFHQAVFHDTASFIVTRFNRDVRFDQARFNAGAGFMKTAFNGKASFPETTFSSSAWFNEALFTGEAQFPRVSFGDYAGFNDTLFSDHADFAAAIFIGNANFRKADFDGKTRFNETAFTNAACFDEADFYGETEFRGTTFGNAASFNLATFHTGADLSKSSFTGDATFLATTFNGRADFNETVFFGRAVYRQTIFNSDALFGGSVNHLPPGDTDLSSRLSSNSFAWVSFADAKFYGRARFINRRFLHATDFSGGLFSRAPEFHNCELHQDTDFSARKFLDKQSPTAVRAYRTLKTAMHHLHANSEAADFFALEQQSLRAQKSTPTSTKFLSWLYEKTSDYGNSLRLPLVWFCATSVGFFLIYLALLTGKTITWGDIGEVSRVFLEQIFAPFQVFGDSGTSSIVFLVVCASHSLLDLTLLTLFIIALHRRFKLA